MPEQVAVATRLQHQQRTRRPHGRQVCSGPAADRGDTEGARALTLRAAHTGTGNLVGQDLTARGLAEPEDPVEKLAGRGWPGIPGTVGDLLASRPENPTPITVPSPVPYKDGTGPFTFGKKMMRPRISGWAQKAVSNKKLRKARATAGTRLLALTPATRTDESGRLGPGRKGIALHALATMVPVGPGELQHLVGQLTAADWLTEAALTEAQLTGQLTERVLPLTYPSGLEVRHRPSEPVTVSSVLARPPAG